MDRTGPFLLGNPRRSWDSRGMKRFFGFSAAAAALSFAGACSLINAPDDVQPGASGSGGGGAPACNDDCSKLDDVCAKGVCEGGKCVTSPANEGDSCNDGKFCTDNDRCEAGTCKGEPKVCPDLDDCRAGVCDEEAKHCTVNDAPDGAACDDENACTGDGICLGGLCQTGVEICANLTDDCNTSVCVDAETGCMVTPVNEGGICNITVCGRGTCSNGTCSDYVAQFGSDNLPCTDNDYCTVNERCELGECKAGDGDRCPPDQGCGTWTCDRLQQKCVSSPENEGMECDDAQSCTANSTCSLGTCRAGTGGATIYFQDDFRDASKGWTFEPDPSTGPVPPNYWTIGEAQESPVTKVVGHDPDLDHTPTADNGIAGVHLGGFVPTDCGGVPPSPDCVCADPFTAPCHAPYCMVSPPIDTSAARGEIWFSFYRWLLSDQAPFVTSTVEIRENQFDTWHVLYTNPNQNAVTDSEWKHFSYQITDYKSDALQVRFCYALVSSAYSAGSWNIDDVVIADEDCE
jgi:hypothetical protein